MKYQVDLKLEAHQDIFEAMVWYGTQREGLGAEFYEEVEKVKTYLSSDPYIFEVKYKKNVRWTLTDRFPYIVVYIIDEMKVVILAVVSTHRHPKIWKNRA